MKRILSFIFALLMVLPLPLSAGASPASTVSSPLEDLRACENFSEDDYPVNENDTSLSVIHLAESVDGGVLLYVYCPSQKLIASSVNLSLTETTPDGDILDFQLYNLKVRSQEGVFQKYIVEGLTVPDKFVRHYEVASILRPWDENIDAAPTDDNTIHEVPYEVGYMWSYLSGDDGQYVVNRRNVIAVTNKHVGFVTYDELDLIIHKNGFDSHYVAFSTNKKIDKLLSVDLVYKAEKEVWGNFYGRQVFYDTIYADELGPIDVAPVHLTSEQVFKNDSIFWGYEYERIQRTEDFLSKEDLTDYTREAIGGTEWVLRFAETDYLLWEGYYAFTHEAWYRHFVDVKEVTLLRMEFETDGILYNMGVVDDVRSGDNIPDNNVDGPPEWFIILVSVLAVLALLVVLWVCSLAAPILKPVLSALVWILLLPFKLLWWLIKAIWNWIQKE